MTVWIVLDEDKEFVGAYSTKPMATRFIENSDFDIFPYEIEISAEQHQQEITDEVLGYCLYCDTPLTRQNIYYGEDNKPLACYKCASGRYY